MMHRAKISLLSLVGLLLLACEPQVRPIHYGQDGCSHCLMTIVEEGYGAELLSNKGKAYTFDSIECLAAFMTTGQVPEQDIHGLYFTDFEAAGHLFPLEELVFVQAAKLKSPMGLNLSAYRNPVTAANVAELYFGEILTWSQVREFVTRSWLK